MNESKTFIHSSLNPVCNAALIFWPGVGCTAMSKTDIVPTSGNLKGFSHTPISEELWKTPSEQWRIVSDILPVQIITTMEILTCTWKKADFIFKTVEHIKRWKPYSMRRAGIRLQHVWEINTKSGLTYYSSEQRQYCVSGHRKGLPSTRQKILGCSTKQFVGVRFSTIAHRCFW